MIVVDASALIAIILREAEASVFSQLLAVEISCIAAPTVLEAHLVLTQRIPGHGALLLRELLAVENIEIASFDERMMRISRDAFDSFGKGRHPAKLNFGDCMSYALAKSRDLPLLYKGADFALTDIRPAYRA